MTQCDVDFPSLFPDAQKMAHFTELASDAFDRMSPASLINQVPPVVQAAMIDAHKTHPEFFGLDERALYKSLREKNMCPSTTDNRLRLSFWLEYERAMGSGKMMNMHNVFSGLVSGQFFYKTYLASPTRIAWLLCIPADYDVMMEEGVSFGVELLRSYLDIDALSGGKPNTKVMEIQLKIVMMLDMRLKGGHTQKIEQRNLSLNVSTSSKQIAQAVGELSMEAVEKRLKALDARERELLGQGSKALGGPPSPEVEE